MAYYFELMQCCDIVVMVMQYFGNVYIATLCHPSTLSPLAPRYRKSVKWFEGEVKAVNDPAKTKAAARCWIGSKQPKCGADVSTITTCTT